MSDPNWPPTPQPPPAPPPPVAPPPQPVGTAGIVLAVLAILGGLGCLLPGGICSAMGVVFQFENDGNMRETGLVFLAIGVPLLVVGGLLLWFAWRKLRAAYRRPA